MCVAILVLCKDLCFLNVYGEQLSPVRFRNSQLNTASPSLLPPLFVKTALYLL